MNDSEFIGEENLNSDATTSEPSGVRERLTLHVRKRLSGELQIVKKDGPSPPVDDTQQDSAPSKKRSKKGKKKTKSSNSSSSNRPTPTRRVRVKQETSPVEGDGHIETPEGSDEAISRLQSPAMEDEAAVQAARESFFNNALLTEILNEKKRALFESEEILELIREKLRGAPT